LLALLAGAVVAVALAVLGLVLVVRAALRDEGDELLDLEAQGASPALLLRVVRVRVAVLGAVGSAAGLGTGLVLLALVGRVVTVTSGAQAPEPPLAVTLGSPLVLLAGLGVSGVAAAAVLLATRRGPPEPGRHSA
jgi:ABC-type antimicrobial peptide transport system permease subunit